MSRIRAGVIVPLWVLCALVSSPVMSSQPLESVGREIYLHGVTSNGRPLQASRAGGGETTGIEAACVNCHRHSGLGSVEGQVKTPPITGRYLFQPRGNSTLPYVESVRANREPYNDASLARAIRDGTDSDGRRLGQLMPRFALSESDMQALTAYLKSLDRSRIPGVTESVLHFATVVTSDVDPGKAKGVLDVIEHYFADKNSFNTVPTRRIHASGRTMAGETMFMVHRRYELHEWKLTGSPAGWDEQLRQHMRAQPVLAVVSGIGGSHWEAVHDFCEREHVPCLFPNVEVPVSSPSDFYSMYLSGGVLLEAQLVAQQLTAQSTRSGTIRQIYRAGDSGAAAARALTTALHTSGIAVLDQVLRATPHSQDLAHAVRDAGTGDTLILWLRQEDVAALPQTDPLPKLVYLSGLMAGLERAPLPESWRSRTRITYPVDLPEQRVVRVDYPLGWFRIQRIPVVALKEQVDTYLACGLLAENLSHMVDTFVPEYLIERMQEMLEHRVLTGFYPRLTLASGQQFASKGGYMVHFAEPSGERVVADSDWLVPY